MAKNDPSALVRLYLTSGMLRLVPSQRWDVMEALVQKSEDANDHNLPLMYWYAAEPLAEIDAKRAIKIAESAKIPIILEYMKRRLSPQTKDAGVHQH